MKHSEILKYTLPAIITFLLTSQFTLPKIEAAAEAAAERSGPVEPSTQSEYTLLTAAEVERAFRQIPRTPPTNKKIIETDHYNVAVAQVRNRNGGPEFHRDSDRVFFIKRGKAAMRIGGRITDPKEDSLGEIRSISGEGYTGYREVTISAGALLSIPRKTTYQVIAKDNDVSYLVVRTN